MLAVVKDPAKREATSARLVADVEGAGVARADLVIEAIFENLEAKRALYAKLEESMKPEGLLVSNTSSIPLTDSILSSARTRSTGARSSSAVALPALSQAMIR